MDPGHRLRAAHKSLTFVPARAGVSDPCFIIDAHLRPTNLGVAGRLAHADPDGPRCQRVGSVVTRHLIHRSAVSQRREHSIRYAERLRGPHTCVARQCRFAHRVSVRCRPTSSLSPVCQSPIVTGLAGSSPLTAGDDLRPRRAPRDRFTRPSGRTRGIKARSVNRSYIGAASDGLTRRQCLPPSVTPGW